MKIKRRGRPRKSRFFAPLSLIIAFIVSVVIAGYFARSSELWEMVAVASDKQLTYSNFYASDLAEENKLLEDKLARSMKTETSGVTKELVRLAIQRTFPKESWTAAEKVITCESGMNPLSLNDKNTNGSVDRGPWQINSVHAKRFEQMYGVKWEIGAHDIELSTKYAKFLYDHQGFKPWVCAKIVDV